MKIRKTDNSELKLYILRNGNCYTKRGDDTYIYNFVHKEIKLNTVKYLKTTNSRNSLI